MKIEVWSIGITKEKFLREGQNLYLNRLKHYCQLTWLEFKEPKHGAKHSLAIKKAHSKFLMDKIQDSDIVVLLDEQGNQISSIDFSVKLEHWQNQGIKRLVFIIGGAFGFDDELYKRANYKLGLSKMTFTHLMVRMFFLEQLYRAFTILKGEKYHNK